MGPRETPEVRRAASADRPPGASTEPSRLDAALLILCALLPAAAVAAGAARVPLPAHDEATVRVVGWGAAGLWRGADALWAAPWLALPLGTRATRAVLASGAAAGMLGALVFAAARRTLAAMAGAASSTTSRRLASATAAIGAVLATLGGAGQVEALGAGGAALGAVFALGPAWALSRDEDGETLAALLVGLAASYQPDVLACAVAGAAAAMALRGTPPPGRRTLVVAAGAFLAGLAPLGWAAWRRAISTSLFASVSAWAAPLGERGESTRSTAAVLLRHELGVVALALAALGAVVGMLRGRARARTAPPIAVAVVGAAAMALGAPAGPTRYGAAALATLAAVSWLAAIGMFVAADWVRGTKVPFAAASAGMVVLLEVAVAAKSADDGLLAAAARTPGAAQAFDTAAFGGAEVHAVVVTGDHRVALRAVALRAAGDLRGDLSLLFAGDTAGPGARLELARDGRLAGYVRDVALYGAPEEFSLSGGGRASAADRLRLALGAQAGDASGARRPLRPVLGGAARLER